MKSRILLWSVSALSVLSFVLLLVVSSALQVDAQGNAYTLTVNESPSEFGSPAMQCAVLSANGHTVQSCFVKAGQICNAGDTGTVGPVDEDGIPGYWVKLDRRSNCTSSIRIGVPDIACHILLPVGDIPSISCVVR